MLNCVIHYRDEQTAVFCLEDFPELDSVNIGGDKRCEVCLADKWNAAPVLVSLTRIDSEAVAVPGGETPLEVDGKTVSSVRVVPGTILKCGDFSLVFSGDLVDSGKLLLWRVGRGKAQYASLGYGANLIGSGSECRCVIEAPGIPALLARCWIGQDSVSLDPMAAGHGIRLRGRRTEGTVHLEEGEVIELARGVQAAVLDKTRLERALKSPNPFYPELVTWQFAVLGAMLLFVGAAFCYTSFGEAEEPGKAFRSVNSLPRYMGKGEEDYLKELNAVWIPLLEQGKYKAVQADLELLMENPKLPETLRKRFTAMNQRLDAERHGIRLARYYRSKLEIYSPRAMARHYQDIEIQSMRWNKGVENNLAYWNAAHSHLKDAMNRRTEAGDAEHSPFLKKCVSLHEQIDGILAFYRTNQDIAKAYAEGDFSLALKLAEQPEFQKRLRLYRDCGRFMEETRLGRDLHRLEMMSADPGFSPAGLPELAGSLKSLQERVTKKKHWGSAFKEPEIRRRIAMLDKFASGLSSARQAETAFLAKGDGNALLSARQAFWQLGLSPLFAGNRYVHEKGKMFSGRILQAVEDEKLPLEERGRLLAAERSMLLDDQISRSRLDALKEKLEAESNTLCDQLYAEWCKAAPAEKRALAEKILRKALPDTAYHEWAEKQLSGQQ